MVLMVVCWRYRMPFDASGCVSTLTNVDWIKWMYFCVNDFQISINDSMFSGNEQQKVYYALGIVKFRLGKISLLRNWNFISPNVQ